MSEEFAYSTTYVLDKSHFSETYDQSQINIDLRKAYGKAAAISLLGLVLLQTESLNPYICWFIMCLGGLEAVSTRFHKAFWLGRQLISKAANNSLTLIINDEGIHTQSNYVNGSILWQDMNKVEKTDAGWLVFHKGGKSYISDRCLDDETQEFIKRKGQC